MTGNWVEMLVLYSLFIYSLFSYEASCLYELLLALCGMSCDVGKKCASAKYNKMIHVSPHAYYWLSMNGMGKTAEIGLKYEVLLKRG